MPLTSTKAEGVPLMPISTRTMKPRKMATQKIRECTPGRNNDAHQYSTSTRAVPQRNQSARSVKVSRNTSPVQNTKLSKSPTSSRNIRGKENKVLTPKTRNFDIAGSFKDAPIKENKGETMSDPDSDRLLDSLREGCSRQFDPAKLTSHFLNILNNPKMKASHTFMPRDKCQQMKDGRQLMQLGDTSIYYDDTVIDSIINFGMRSRVSNTANAN